MLTFCVFRRSYKLLCTLFYVDWYVIYSLYIELADGKKTATHLGKNKLDKERVKMCIVEVVSISNIAF